MIVGASGLALKFTGYECVKWVEATELHRPSQRHRQPGQPPPYDPIAAIPPNQIAHTDVFLILSRIWISLIVSQKATMTLISDLSTSEHPPIGTSECSILRRETSLLSAK